MTTATARSDVALDFIKRELTLPDGRHLGETLPADPWLEEKVLRPILARGEDGLPLYRQVYNELARGHFKTGIVAAVALAEALTRQRKDVIAIAKDQDQAGLILEALRGQCSRNPVLAQVVVQRRWELLVRRTGSRIRVMSSDAPSFYGIGVDALSLMIVGDEFGQWPTRDLYDAAMTTLPKLADAQLVIISNAGIKGSWQEEVRAAVAANGYLFSAPGVIASWIRPEDLAQVEASVPPPVYRRFYLNEWVAAEGEFVPMELWDSCKADLPPLREREPVIVGVDAAVSGDCFACVAVTRAPDSPKDAVAVRDVRIWAPPPGGTIDFQEPWDYLAGLRQSKKVVQLTFDPFQLHDFMTRFMRQESVWCEPFSQMGERAKADSDLFQLIRSGRLRHDGDPGLREHIANCGFKIAAQEDTRARLVKRGKGKIDAAVALSMAARQCLYLVLENVHAHSMEGWQR